MSRTVSDVIIETLIDLVMALLQFIPYVVVKFPEMERKKINVVMDENSGDPPDISYMFY